MVLGGGPPGRVGGCRFLNGENEEQICLLLFVCLDFMVKDFLLRKQFLFMLNKIFAF